MPRKQLFYLRLQKTAENFCLIFPSASGSRLETSLSEIRWKKKKTLVSAFELTLHPNMSSAHFSVSLQFSMVPVWSDIETANSYCVLILCCEVELPARGFCDAAHSGFEHVSLRRATLWLHITLKQERKKKNG